MIYYEEVANADANANTDMFDNIDYKERTIDINTNKFKSEIEQSLDEIEKLLLSKNQAYGNSVLSNNDFEIFSNSANMNNNSKLYMRIDTKLNRIKHEMQNHFIFMNDLNDLIGYLILLYIISNRDTTDANDATDKFQKNIRDVLGIIYNKLVDANEKYGNIFYYENFFYKNIVEPDETSIYDAHKIATMRIKIALDDKLRRVSIGHEYPGDDTIIDIIGYLFLLKIAFVNNNQLLND